MINSSAAMRALALAVRHINASSRDALDEAQLLDALLSPAPPDALEPQLRAFFDETDCETLSDLARSGAIGYAELSRGAARYVPANHPTRRWLDERA